MRITPRTNRLASVLIALALVVAGLTTIAGCSTGTKPVATNAKSELTPPFVPPPPVLTNPVAAVRSYLYWISYAYRVADSSVASRTFDNYEEVRVSSYVEYNNEQNRAIEQMLVKWTSGKVTYRGEGTATVPAHESWTYRYIFIPKRTYETTVPYTASYDTTYTVVRGSDGLWRVHQVDARPIGTVK